MGSALAMLLAEVFGVQVEEMRSLSTITPTNGIAIAPTIRDWK